MPFAKQNPRFPEGINASDEHPLKEFLLLLLGMVLGTVCVVAVLALSARSGSRGDSEQPARERSS